MIYLIMMIIAFSMCFVEQLLTHSWIGAIGWFVLTLIAVLFTMLIHYNKIMR